MAGPVYTIMDPIYHGPVSAGDSSTWQSVGKGPSERRGPANADPSYLARIGRKAREFSFGLWKLRNLKNVPPELQADHATVLSRVGAIEATVTRAYGGLSSMAKWAGLSALPLIPLGTAAVILGGLALGSSLIANFMKRYDAYQIRIGNPELSYADALDKAGAGDSGGLFDVDFGGKWVLPILAVGAA